MSFWSPDLAGHTGPKYRAIVDALAADIGAGVLGDGAKLPPQRELAWSLKITVGTVARAYVEAERLGLVSGEVGRGTFVKPRPAEPLRLREAGAQTDGGGLIDMARNRPSYGVASSLIGPALARLGTSALLPELLDYEFLGGHEDYRAAGAAWVARDGVSAAPESVALTVGGQHAILAAIAAISRPGEPVFGEALTYPGLKLATAFLDRKLECLPIDEHGLIPEAVDRALAARPGGLVYGMTTHHNPTTVTMPLARREEIAAILRRREGYFIEDGIYAFLSDQALPPLQSLAPERVVYVTSLSKAISPGLRLGFAVAPVPLAARIVAATRAAATMPPILLARLATDLIADGSAFTAVAAQKAETAKRLAIAREYLPDACPATTSPHLWLQLPDPWRADPFAAAAYRRGVATSPASDFATSRQMPDAVRVSISAPRDHAQLRRGLGVIRDLLNEPPPLSGAMI